jgi:hypothetical protein
LQRGCSGAAKGRKERLPAEGSRLKNNFLVVFSGMSVYPEFRNCMAAKERKERRDRSGGVISAEKNWPPFFPQDQPGFLCVLCVLSRPTSVFRLKTTDHPFSKLLFRDYAVDKCRLKCG